ncbi:Tyrosine-protein phosphatase non-receptor type 14 [Nibea albiflora]|uniref:Tyrosine-protein phosphatase non-receptor type 14 n=1 Tax=Nibea albiflora TaxID=240163 RepID=A0ACB7FB95_NIBAL|nr:Tyrosine-protein phosphatase non-receptor type 14 [Nibea albiflora]
MDVCARLFDVHSAVAFTSLPLSPSFARRWASRDWRKRSCHNYRIKPCYRAIPASANVVAPLLLSLHPRSPFSSSSSSSSSPDIFGNGPAPCQGASFHPVVWLASCESEEGSGQPAMPFRLKLRRTRRYNVLSKNYFVTRIRLLDSNAIECTLSVESTGQECLEAVAQRLELRETHYFGLWFQGKTPAHRWVELEKPLKKQLDKFGNEPLLFFGVMFYVPSVSRLEQEATRLLGHLAACLERGLNMRGHIKGSLCLCGCLECQQSTLPWWKSQVTLSEESATSRLTDFGDFTQFMSQDFLREYVLFPVNWPNGEEVLEDWTQKVAEEHKSHCRMQTAEAELLYIKEVEKLDGFGQESFPAKEDMEMAKYIARLFTARHKFYKQNKICAEPTHSPAPIRRRPTWNHRPSLPRPQSCNFQSMHSQYGEHYQDTQSSQDSIFHDDQYFKSESSLDRCPVDFPFRNGTVPNGSMYSSPSLSSLNHSQTFVPPSPMSSNLSIPGSELMRPDYIPSHRHSAIIAPSYRPTPEYDAVMRQKRSMLPAHHDHHSQSLRSLNISNACAYRQPVPLVYSQPEMRERSPYHGLGPSPGQYTPQISYSKPVSHGPHQGGPASNQGPCHSPCVNGGGGSGGVGGVGSSISHTVSTPELANTKQQGNNGGSYAATANMLRNHIFAMLPVPVTMTPGFSSLLKTLERQKMSVDSMKRPLMMAALNGLYVARMPVPESPAEDGAKAATDERVPKKRADCVLTTATLPENTERNRFRDVVPYEENRVELVPNKENNTGYINASHIKVMIRGEEWHYIATQGPLANTCADFWQMVWEQGVNVIAMVTAEEEGGRSKSHRYWPKLGSKHNSATHGKFKVTTKFRTDSGCYATTGLKVKHLLSGQERTVWHLQYTDWPEQGCPEYVQGFLSYLEEIQSVRRHTNSMLDTSKSLNPPVVVHCSAGVGRTGVVILTELMISCLEHNEPVEVPAMLSGLRQQRMLMVQTISQYKFVYQVLIQFLKNSRLI